MQHSVDGSRFEVLGRLGCGGTAEVFRVTLRGRSRQVALKCPLPDSSSSHIDFPKLAAREGMLIGGLRFPGLVRLLEVPTEHSDYLLMELCEGPTLDSIGKVSDPALALNLLAAIALDLHFLHIKGIIHGDFKPHNVFLPQDWKAFGDGALRYAKLSDFSLGRFEREPEMARAGLGTVGYMAPETVVAGESSHRSDLFAYGVTAYQLLTGIHPFMQGESDPVRVNANVREVIPEAIDKFRSDLSPALVGLISSLLAKDEDGRPATALQVCQRLAEAGATYPYQRALAPKYILESDAPYGQAKAICRDLSDKQSSWLDIITEGNTGKLRQVLTCNYSRGSLELAETGYRFTGELYWPVRLRRQVLSSFAAFPLSTKRNAVAGAVRSEAQDSESNSALNHLLLPLLHWRTVKRISLKFGLHSERAEKYRLATRLYLQAGDLEGADRCAYQAASLLRGEHRADEAVRSINAVLDLAHLQGKLAELRSLMMLKGDILKESGEIDKAHSTYQQIIGLYNSLPPDKLLAETYKDMGDLYRMRQDAAAGLESLQKALNIFRQLGDELEVSRTLNNIGNSYFYAGDLAQTLRQYRQAVRIQRRLGAVAEVASTLTNLGSVYLVKGRFSRGVLLLNKSLEIKKDLGNIGEIARTYNNLGYAYYVLGRYDESQSSLQESLVLNRRIGNRKEILVNLESLANLGLTAGFLRDSLEYLQEGLDLATEAGDKPHQALFYHLLSQAYLRMGRISEAQQALGAVTALLPGIDDPQLACNAELTSGSIRFAVGDVSGARKCWSAALRLAVTSENKPLVLAAQIELVRLGTEVEVADEARQMAAELGLEREQKIIAFNHAESLLDHDSGPQAINLLADVRISLAQLKTDIDSARLHCIVAELLVAQQDFAEAKSMLAKGLQQAQMSGLVPEVARCLTLAAQIESRERNFEGAFAKYRQALQLYKQIADTLSSDADRSFFQGKRSIRFLVEEIRRLGKLLEQKQRAG